MTHARGAFSPRQVSLDNNDQIERTSFMNRHDPPRFLGFYLYIHFRELSLFRNVSSRLALSSSNFRALKQRPPPHSLGSHTAPIISEIIPHCLIAHIIVFFPNPQLESVSQIRTLDFDSRFFSSQFLYFRSLPLLSFRSPVLCDSHSRFKTKPRHTFAMPMQGSSPLARSL